MTTSIPLAQLAALDREIEKLKASTQRLEDQRRRMFAAMRAEIDLRLRRVEERRVQA